MVRTWLTVLAVLTGIGFACAADLSTPLRVDKQWNQAKKDLAQGRAAEAKAAFEELLKRNPNEADLHLFRGMSLLRLRDPQGAILEARKAIELNPRHLDARTVSGLD